MSEVVTLCESVKTYLKDGSIETGVDHLLGKGGNRIADNLSWDELGDFIAARSASIQVKHDYALALSSAWAKVWEQHVAALKFLSIDEQIDYDPDVSPHPDSVWEWGSWIRLHRSSEKKRPMTYTAVSLDKSGLQIGVGAFDRRDSPIFKKLKGFTYDTDNLMCWSDDRAPIDDAGTIDISALREPLRVAIEALKQNGAM